MCTWDVVAEYVRRAPATYVYLFTLTVTTWLLQTASQPVAQRLLLEQSTNLDRLEHHPIRVLVSSAFFLAHARDLALWAVLFTLVLAPAERWLGSWRWIGTFALGHVGATLATAGVLWLAIRWDVVESRLGRVQDVGASYGFFAVAGAFTFAFHGRRRLLYAAAVWAAVAVGLAVADGFTNVGHAIAVCLGYFAWWAFGPTRGRGSRGSWPSAHSAATPARGSPSSPS